MSPSVEDSSTVSPSATTEQNGQDHVQSNHHGPSSPTSPSIAEVRGKRKPPPRRGSIDKDAQELVISSLRDQVQDLVSQVTELNNKLVNSYDRVSDLEDDLHETSSSLRTSSVKISQLELERSQHLSALNTGLLVEKTHVTAELTRLMEKATEEAARRGQAESARADIEKDLDDVSAALFDQANTMVAEARWGRAQSERKAEEAERALVEAEDAVRLMQQELQSFQEEKEDAERSMENMRAAMGKGKWVQRASLPVNAHHLLTSHVSYQEFLALISHLRALRATSSQAPSLNSLLGLPFMARLQVEDTDPTIRLDLAAALNWLSRRSIIAAIQSGQLTIEPIATQTILASATFPQSPLAVTIIHGTSNGNLLSCGLCGQGIVPQGESSPSRTGHLPRVNGTQFNTWSSSIFRKSSIAQSSSAPPSPPPYHDTSSLPAQIYIFRLSEPSSAFPSALPLCVSGWCLARLRTTCSLWSFLRTNVVEKIWEEEVQRSPPPPRRDIGGVRPVVPPRRKTKSAGFWGVASTFGLDRVSAWGESDKDKRAETEPERRRFVAPPLRSNSPGPSSLGPPPLPKRNRSRVRTSAPADSGAEGRRSSVTEPPARESQSSASDSRASQEQPVTAKPEESPTLCDLLDSSGEAEDADPSNEGFLTPTEEFAPPNRLSFSPEPPASIPPPDPSQNTPVATLVPIPDETNKTSTELEAPQPESKPAEPVAAHRKSSSLEYAEPHPRPPGAPPVSPPPRTGSPGAPPLPRRAAARRAVPPLPPAAPPAPAPPAQTADVNPTEIAEQPNGHHVEQTEARAEPEVKADIPNPVAAPESDPPSSAEPQKEKDGEEKEGQVDVSPAVETSGPAVSESETAGAEAQIVGVTEEAVELSGDQSGEKQEPQPERPLSGDISAPRGDATIENPVEVAGTTTTTTTEPDAETERPSVGLEKMKMPAAEEKAATPPRTRHAPLPPPRGPRPVRSTERRALSEIASSLGDVGVGVGAGAGKSDKPGAEPEFAPDGTPYVGDGTWEERTWRELTRLREDMFWARVGSAQ